MFPVLPSPWAAPPPRNGTGVLGLSRPRHRTTRPPRHSVDGNGGSIDSAVGRAAVGCAERAPSAASGESERERAEENGARSHPSTHCAYTRPTRTHSRSNGARPSVTGTRTARDAPLPNFSCSRWRPAQSPRENCRRSSVGGSGSCPDSPSCSRRSRSCRCSSTW